MSATNLRIRNIEELAFKSLMALALAFVLLSLISVVAIVVIKGVGAISLDMLTKTPKGGYYLGKEGGVLNAIVGSIYLAIGATALAFIVSFPTAVFLNEYASSNSAGRGIGGGNVVSGRLGEWFAGFVRRSLDILWGMPSIIYGSFGFIVMVTIGMRASLLGGIIVLTMLEIPIMTRAMDEVMRMVPSRLKEASYALGATRIQTTVGVVARQALPGIATAITLAFGRAIGDAASVLFTTGFSDSVPSSLFDPAASLPLAIFFQLGTPFPQVQARAYASGLILLIMVLSLNIISMIASKRFERFQVR